MVYIDYIIKIFVKNEIFANKVNTCYYEEIKTYSILIVKFNNKKFENGIS